MNALSTLKWPSSGNQSINDNGVYRLLLRPQKCRVSVKRQMVNGKHAHAPEVCNIVWLLAEWKGGGEEGRTEILLIKFAKLFAIKPLSCWTNNVQHATASSNSSNGATNTTICSRTTVRIAISVWFPSLSISLCGVCCPCLSIYCVAAAAAPAWGKCFCIAAVARLHHTRVSQCVCLSVCVEVILKIASQESSPPNASLCPFFTLSTAAASVRFTWQKLCAVSTFDYCWGSFCLPEARYMYTQVHINIPH